MIHSAPQIGSLIAIARSSSRPQDEPPSDRGSPPDGTTTRTSSGDESVGHSDTGSDRAPRLSALDRFGVGMAGLYAPLVARLPEERPTLVGLGLQLTTTWLLYLFVLGIAFTTLAAGLGAGLPIALLAASMIVLADRTFILGDIYNQGRYEELKHNNPQDSDLRGIKLLRIALMTVRYSFAIALSWIVISIATPGLLNEEVTTEIHRMDKERNAGAHERLAEIRERRREDLETARARLDALDGRTADLEQKLDEARAQSLALAVAEAGSGDRIDGLRAQARALRDGETLARECARAEEIGVTNPSCEEIPGTGVSGCGKQCELWRAKEVSLAQQAERIEAELGQAIAVGRSTRSANSRHVATLEADLAAARTERASRMAEEQAAEQAMLATDRDIPLKQLQDYQEVKQGLVVVFQAAERILAAADADVADDAETHAGNPVTTMLLMVKLLLIALESLIFTGRLLGGGTQSYARLIYRLQQARVAAPGVAL